MRSTSLLSILLPLLLLQPVAEQAQQRHSSHAVSRGGDHGGMIPLPAGEFKPFLLANGQQRAVKIHSFYMDVHAVTNGEFLAFVRANPEWERSNVPRIFADINYLKHWKGDLEIGDDRIRNSPVTNVSWFAANAYCKWKGKRLPTLAEWEYGGGVSPVNEKHTRDLTRIILGWYDHPTPAVLPAVESTYKNRFGLWDMHGLVWEWVDDFNSILPQAGAGSREPATNVFVCGAGSFGTANKKDYAAYMRYAFRESLQATYTVRSLGFRCVRDIE
jgi:sulfatase modifying factor 1